MAIGKKLFVAALFLVGASIASVLGHRHFARNIAPGLEKEATRLEFSLLEVEGGLFESAKRLQERGTIVFYLPDDISSDTQRKYAEIVRRSAKRRVKTKDLILVSRLDADNMRNMKRISSFEGTLLLDPSGSLLQKVRKWKPERMSAEWTTIELGRAGEIRRLATGENPEISWLE